MFHCQTFSVFLPHLPLPFVLLSISGQDKHKHDKHPALIRKIKTGVKVAKKKQKSRRVLNIFIHFNIQKKWAQIKVSLRIVLWAKSQFMVCYPHNFILFCSSWFFLLGSQKPIKMFQFFYDYTSVYQFEGHKIKCIIKMILMVSYLCCVS